MKTTVNKGMDVKEAPASCENADCWLGDVDANLQD